MALPGCERRALQQGAERGDADAGADHHHVVPAPGGGAEQPVGSFHGHLGAGLQPSQLRRAPAEVADGDPQRALPVGVELHGLGGQAERVRMPPQAGGQEPPDEEPAAAARQLVQLQAGHFNADHAGGHRAPRGSTVSWCRKVATQRLDHPVVQQRGAGGDADGQPVPALPGALGKEPAHAELVGERGQDGGVGQQVDGVPEFVGETTPDGHQGGDHDGDEQGHGDDRPATCPAPGPTAQPTR